MALINQISDANTFGDWLTSTQGLIEHANHFSNTSNLVFVTANNTVNVYSNTVNVYSNTVTVYDNTLAINGVANTAANNANAASNNANTANLNAWSAAASASGSSSSGSIYATYAQANATIAFSNATYARTNATYAASNATYAQANATIAYSNAQYAFANATIAYSNATYAQANATSAATASNNANTASNNANTANTNAHTANTNAWNSRTQITDDVTTDAKRYILLTPQTTGSLTIANTSTTKLYYNCAIGTAYATAFTNMSDETLKSNIITIENALDTVANLRGVSFTWKDTNQKSLGVIAQEVESFVPELVFTEDGVKSVSYGNFVGILIEAIKDLKQRVEALENK